MSNVDAPSKVDFACPCGESVLLNLKDTLYKICFPTNTGEKFDQSEGVISSCDICGTECSEWIPQKAEGKSKKQNKDVEYGEWKRLNIVEK